MGKALIKKSLGSGLYEISYIFNNDEVAQRITELNNKINQLDNVEIPAQEALVSAAESVLSDAEDDLTTAIATDIREDIVNANTAVIQSRTYLEKQERELSYLRLTRSSFSKSVDFLGKNTKANITEQVWCADFNTELTGEVGSIEIIGERLHAVIIRPGGENGDQSGFVAATDGNMTPAAGMSPFGWLYNTMQFPGWQKWMGKYRIGTIRKFSGDDPNRCDLDLDPAFSSSQDLNVNQESRVYNIPIVYQDCNEEVFKAGDRVVVEYTGNTTDKFPFTATRVIGFESNPRPCGISFITWEGSSTISYNRRYYNLRQGELEIQPSLPQWDLTDDGKYSLIWDGISHENPNDYNYRTIPTEGDDGMRVPETDAGISAKNQDQTKVRFMTNQSLEDEVWIAFEVDAGFIYQFINMFDSLTRTPYKIKPKASICRYAIVGDKWWDFSIITQHRQLEVDPYGSAILLTKTWLTHTFGDFFPYIPRASVWSLNGDSFYRGLDNGGTAIPAISSSVQFYPNLSGDLLYIRADAFTVGLAQLAEPLSGIQDNIRGVAEGGFISGPEYIPKTYYRSWDKSTHDVYMMDANTIFGKIVDVDGFTTRTGQQFINNDITLPYGQKYTGELTYVRKRKNTEYTIHNTGLYVADKLVEESGYQEVITLYNDIHTDTLDIPAEFNAPIQIRQTEYYPLSVYHDDAMDLCLYRKVTYISHEDDLLPYKTPRYVLGSTIDAQIRRTITTFKTDYYITLNGRITPLSKLADPMIIDLISEDVRGTYLRGLYYYIITAFNTKGETEGSEQLSVVILIDPTLGLLSVIEGSVDIVGSGTAFSTDLSSGITIQILDTVYTVDTITDDTHLTVTVAYARNTQSNIPFNLTKGIHLTWTRVDGASGYRIYGVEKDGSVRIGEVSSPDILSWVDRGETTSELVPPFENTTGFIEGIVAREHRLTVLSTAYSGPAIPSVIGFAFGPWSDVGYDKDGVATEEDNSQLSRIFSSATDGSLFIGFDVFPVNFKHNLNVTNDILHPDFDDSVLNFPPYIDLEYVTPKARKWLVFNKSGNIQYDITPPTANRVNGVCMLDPRG